MKNRFLFVTLMVVFSLLLAACGPQAGEGEPTLPAELQPTLPEGLEPTMPVDLEPTLPAEVEPTMPAEVEPTMPAETEPGAGTEAEPTTAATGEATEAAGEPIPPTGAGAGNTYVLVPKNLGNPYFDTANTGAQEAAEELGVTVNYQGSATADATEQIQLLNSLIAQEVNGLAISANDADALVPTGQQAMDSGIPVVTWDSAISEGGRTIHINQAEAAGIAQVQIQMASELAGGEGQIAILSATSTAPNQNEWIALMEEELQKPEYANLELVTTVYGDDEDEKSYNEANGLMQTYPDLKVIIAPTTVGIAAAARAVQDAGRVGEVFVTGLGTPNQMRDYVMSGASPQFALWNPADLGYLSVYALHAIATGEIEGSPGDTFSAGRLGEYTVQDDGTVLLGPPTVFNEDNINDFDF
ncbi:MAG: rhamnose ABC transporter substrate-binding protein [Chloroflexi bacterium]|nr:rhamnose ABC transporter substrate-binding protein [Chloroflexota bacterium]